MKTIGFVSAILGTLCFGAFIPALLEGGGNILTCIAFIVMISSIILFVFVAKHERLDRRERGCSFMRYIHTCITCAYNPLHDADTASKNKAIAPLVELALQAVDYGLVNLEDFDNEIARLHGHDHKEIHKLVSELLQQFIQMRVQRKFWRMQAGKEAIHRALVDKYMKQYLSPR